VGKIRPPLAVDALVIKGLVCTRKVLPAYQGGSIGLARTATTAAFSGDALTPWVAALLRWRSPSSRNRLPTRWPRFNLLRSGATAWPLVRVDPDSPQPALNKEFDLLTAYSSDRQSRADSGGRR
jgi:hypothetical protein